jgi:hypothetical protein
VAEKNKVKRPSSCTCGFYGLAINSEAAISCVRFEYVRTEAKRAIMMARIACELIKANEIDAASKRPLDGTGR